MKCSIASSLLVIIMVAGCSTTKPLPEEQYGPTAAMIGGLDLCFNAGKITPKMYAETKAAISYRLSTWTYDQSKLRNKTAALTGKQKATPQLCRMVEATAHSAIANSNSHQQQRAASAAAFSRSLEQMNRNKPVYCNKIGNTTICN
jgi:uncharacterized protein YejL (UPF0352 family)